MKTSAMMLTGVLAAAAFVPRPAPADEFEWKGGEWVARAEPAKGTPEGELALIRKHLADDSPRRAANAAEDFLENYPNDPRCQEAMYLAGQAEMQRGRYWDAYEQFEAQLLRFPKGSFSQRALLREKEIAEAYLAGRNRRVNWVIRVPAEDDGAEILQRIAEHAPKTKLAEECLLRVAEHHASEGDHLAAVQAYDAYLKLFDKSPRAAEAMLKAAQASLAAYRGTEYDDTPLIEAEQRFRLLAERHPKQAKQADVARTLEQIASLRAQKLLETARFYERTKRPSSAAFYYRKLAEAYPDTTWGAQARAALERLGAGEPAPVPTTRPAGVTNEQEGGDQP